MSSRQARLRRLNAHPTQAGGDYVLYWAQAYRRLSHNHSLDDAIRCADELGRPLVVYEGLRLDYPWASARLHRFVLEGMRDNAAQARRLGINYWPFVETERAPARGLLARLASRAAVVVTDDFPCFIVPEQSEALARRVSVPVWAVDGNGVVPLSLLQPAVSAAAHLRPRIHKAFAEAWGHRAAARPRFPDAVRARVDAPFDVWEPPQDLDAFVASLPIDQSVAPVDETRGGVKAARVRLRSFVKHRLAGYAESRSQPA
ncbi:MAG TPA: deoxyribodipyrimidine photolyase, partial [Vicinamibacteria bacterium]|nr:deoxyribodipyrimidine photolyase [Vicinamibacteria bacterium]